MTDKQVALIVGAGAGLSASLARQCAAAGMCVAIADLLTEPTSLRGGVLVGPVKRQAPLRQVRTPGEVVSHFNSLSHVLLQEG